MQSFQMFTHFITQYQKITFTHITTTVVRKVFNYWKAVELMVANINFPKFKFSPLSSDFIIAASTVSCFL